MLTVTGILIVLAFICVILNAIPPYRCPLWIPVFFLCVVELLKVVPLSK